MDPILLEVLRNELSSITEEMAITVHRTAKSPILRMGDFATSLIDAKGRLVGLGAAMHLHATMFMRVMPFILDKYKGAGFKPGDVIICNDPYAGAAHMPDVIVVMPVFHQHQLAGFSIIYSHQPDIGGRFPGGFSSHCAESYEEGIRLSNLKLYEAGVRNEGIVDLLKANIRASDEWMGDIEAKLAGCWRGAREFEQVIEKHGIERVNACFEYLIDHAERTMRAAIAAVPVGDYSGEAMLHDDGFGTPGVQFPIKITLRFRGDKLIVDFTGTSRQLKSALNMPYSNTLGQVFSGVHSVLCQDGVFNSGSVKPIEFIAPSGSLVNPEFPAAVGGRAPVIFLLTDALHSAFSKVLPERIWVPPDGGDVVHISGQRADGSTYTTMDLMWGGWGGRPAMDGVDGAGRSYSTVPVELIEREGPVVVESFGLVADTGGPGKYRGSLSVFREYRFLRPAKIMVRTNRPFEAGAGLAGGGRGGPSVNYLTRVGREPEVLPRGTHVHLEVEPGDRLYHRVAGVAGHGPASERDPKLILRDIAEGKLTPNAAQEQYPVSLDPEALRLATSGKEYC